MLTTWQWNTFILVVTALIAFYKYMTRNFKYWENRGITYVQPKVIFGNIGELFFFKSQLGEWLKEIYDSAPDDSSIGIFVFDEPRLVVRSPELIKKILITDFQHFYDRTIAVPEHNDTESTWLFLVRNPKWKIIRAKMSPLFTSSRIKNMFKIVVDISNDLKSFIETRQGEFECKGLSSRYTMEAIAQCAFGIKPNNFRNTNAEFWRISKTLFDFDLRNGITQFIFFFRQKWVRTFKLNFHRPSKEKYLVNVFLEALEARKGKVSHVNDMIDIINELKGNEQFRTDMEYEGPKVAAQALMFFQAGYETTSTSISFALYELCLHPEIQNKLRREILANVKRNGDITWDGVNEMKYLDMCLAETFRKYPPLPFLDRQANCDYKLPGTDFVIEKGMNIYIPLMGLHYDEKYFEDPYKFNPDRFADGSNDYSSVYMPFGNGPRFCIGERFGRMTAKIALCQLIANFEFIRNERTPVPIVFSTKSALLLSNVGLPMTVRKYTPM